MRTARWLIAETFVLVALCALVVCVGIASLVWSARADVEGLA